MKLIKIFIIFSVIFLVSCNEVLVHDLSENDANKIVSGLHKNEIQAKKVKQADGFWSITVKKSESYKALEYLTSTRIIKSEPIAKNSGSSLIHSREEQLFLHERQLSSEIEYTLKSLPGVLDVRVHLNLPVKDPLFGKNISEDTSASGSVLLITGKEFLSRTSDLQKLVSGASGIASDFISVLIQKSPPNSLSKVIIPINQSNSDKKNITSVLNNINLQIVISISFLFIFFVYLKTRRDKLKLSKLKTIYAKK